MAKKIPQLPAVTIPSGTDLFECVNGGISKKQTATQILAGTVAAYTAADTSLQSQITTLNTTKAPLASPPFTGVPTAPTAAPGTTTTQIANTAFVTTADNLRLRLSGADTMTGSLNMGSNKIVNLTDPTSNQDGATKKYTDDKILTRSTVLEDYNPTVTSAFPLTYNGTTIEKGSRFRITTAGTLASGTVVVQGGDILEALTQAPSNSGNDWSVVQVNTVQATTSVLGILATATDVQAQAKSSTINALTPSNLAALGASETFAGLAEIATQLEVNTGTDDTRYITPLKLKTNLATYSFWGQTGNSGTIEGTNFIGTTDNVSLSLKVNNQLSGRINSSGTTFYGYKAGNSASDPTNSGFGNQALNVITTGLFNLAVGYNTLKATTTGSYNTAIGQYSMIDNISGQNNTAVGNYALYVNLGDNNTAVGNNSLLTNTTGSNNTAIGSGANVGSNNLTNATTIGANSVVNTSNSIVLGSNARVGIGTSSPNSSSILDLTSTTGALLIPRMTTTQKNTLTAVNGMLVYDSTLNKFQGFENGVWVSLI